MKQKQALPKSPLSLVDPSAASMTVACGKKLQAKKMLSAGPGQHSLVVNSMHSSNDPVGIS